jgi:hypothetical protein
VDSVRTNNDEGWDPSWNSYTFAAWLKCNSASCGQDVALIGSSTEERQDYLDEDEEPTQEWRRILRPVFCWPMSDIFPIPESCPKDIRAELRAAFQLFYSDQAAAAGRVRILLERLMNYYRVPRRKKDTNGKYHNFNLHARIDNFSIKKSFAGQKLMALKWLGNSASHQGEISRDDLLNGFEVLEYLLAELFGQQSTRIAKLAQELTKKHARRR